MYTDKRKRGWPLALLGVIVLLSLSLFVWRLERHSREDVGAEGATALKAAVERCATQCYVVEGVYPPDLEYLENSYGLQINREDFYVIYRAFASNMPPEIQVISKP